MEYEHGTAVFVAAELKQYNEEIFSAVVWL